MSLALTIVIVLRSNTIPPSIFVYVLFVGYAILGPIGTGIFMKLYGPYHGMYIIRSEYPLLIWSLGTLFLMAGTTATHLVMNHKASDTILTWHSSRAAMVLWITLGVALISTVFVLVQIGYVPAMKGDINAERAGYAEIAGEYPLKLSRLWLVALPLSSMFMFLTKKRTLYALITIIALLALVVYGQRNYLFLGVVSFVLIYAKFRPLKVQHLLVAIALFVSLILFAEIRSGSDLQKIPPTDLVLLNAAREWREFSIVANHVHTTGQYYGEQIFLGAIVPILPKQIWSVFGLDKDDVTRRYGANYVFGEQFGDAIGIRIGTIGEAYAGFGLYYGVFFQMFLFGAILGFLEILYTRFHQSDARLSVVAFFLSLLVPLPIATLYVTVSYAVFFGFFFVIILLLGTRRTRETEVRAAIRVPVEV
jgi:hypothetical protein